MENKLINKFRFFVSCGLSLQLNQVSDSSIVCNKITKVKRLNQRVERFRDFEKYSIILIPHRHQKIPENSVSIAMIKD
jgi:hypothetical protein